MHCIIAHLPYPEASPYVRFVIAWLVAFGAVRPTKTVERSAGSDEVRGSIPLGSIMNKAFKHKEFRVFKGFFLYLDNDDLRVWSHVWSQQVFF
jgi:hypothetical protein